LAEARERHLGERSDAEIDVGEIVVGGRRAGSGDAPKVGAFGGDAPSVGVLECDGFVGAEAEVIEDEFVEVGFRFRRRNVFAAGEEREAIKQAEAREMGLDPRVLGIGGDGDREIRAARFVEEGDDAGQRSEEFEASFFEELALGFEVGVDGLWPEGEPWVEGVVDVADSAEEERFVKEDAVGRVHVGVGADEGGLGIEDEAVEVEDKGADHGCP
jgi:hypothetical protein